MEGLSSQDDGVNQIPKLRLFEELALHIASIDHLILEQIGVVLVGDLSKSFGTVLIPPLPQNSVFSKRCLMGRKMFSLWGNWAILAYHFLNSISLGSGMMMSMAPSSS